MKISLKQVFKESWKEVKKNLGFLVTLFFIVIFVSVFFGLKNQETVSLFGIIYLLISPLLSYAVASSAIKISRNEKVYLGSILKDLRVKTYLLFLSFVILMNIVLSIFSVLGEFIKQNNPLLGEVVTSLLFLILFVYFIGVMFFPYYRLIDGGKNIWRTIKESFEMGVGNRAFLFKFAIILFFLNIAGILAFGFGILITAPLTSVAIANVYNKIKNKN